MMISLSIVAMLALKTTTAFVISSSSSWSSLSKQRLPKPIELNSNPLHGFGSKSPTTFSSLSRRSPARSTQVWGTLNDKTENDIKPTNESTSRNAQKQEGKGKNALIPDSLTELGLKTWEKIVGLRWVALSFVAGSIFATGAILFPIYETLTMDNLSKPVTLFETILADLEEGYVDPVDTNKLFETGVSAMLRSLDPYTEYEGPEDAVELTESIEGKYGGVGLVISGSTASSNKNKEQLQKSAFQQQEQRQEQQQMPLVVPPPSQGEEDPTPAGQHPISSSSTPSSAMEVGMEDEDEEDEFDLLERKREERLRSKAQKQGIRVVNAFENYAFDYGMRVGDKLVAIDDQPLTTGMTVEDVRNKLRGVPGTTVSISFERDGVDGIQTISMPRAVVSVRDVKLATMLGDPRDGIGYIQLSGFASDTGREMRNAIRYLQRASEDASDGSHSLQGLVLDLRGNPGGLLTSAVDVVSLLVPKGSDIVSAQGRGFPGVLYRSRVDPVLDPNTKLAVLVNRGTASAAEIVSGAVQDLDVGIIVGSDRTFGKGLVQNVEELPYGTALKFTVAKYYTPSGRCIQGINYKEGGGLREEDGSFTANKIPKNLRSVFYTKNGRIVRDGGGIEADYKVDAPKASALEVTLLRSGVMGEFAAEWSKHHELTNNFRVDDDTYRNFQSFVAEKQRSGDLELEILYSKSLDELKKTLKASGYKGSEREVEALQASIVREIQRDFEKYREDIKEDISQSILARYLPERMLIERGVKKDVQVAAAVKLLGTDNRFDKLLARDSPHGSAPSSVLEGPTDAISMKVASTEDHGARGKF
ncbi:hypothetical protein ACA910_000823 [Epithemia clementina (nom. ined.)]